MLFLDHMQQRVMESPGITAFLNLILKFHVNCWDCHLNPLWTKFFFSTFFGHNLIGFSLLPTHRRDAHRKFIWWSLLKIELKFRWKGRPVSSCMGVKGLIEMINNSIILIDFLSNLKKKMKHESLLFTMYALCTNSSKINGTTKGVYLPILKLHSILPAANLLAHNNLWLCYYVEVNSLHPK